MMDVEELERALLEGARKELAPSASDRMRIQSRLVGNPAWFLPAPALRPSLLRGLTRSWQGGLGLGFALGALLGFGAARGVERALGHHSAPVEAATALAAPGSAASLLPAAGELPAGSAAAEPGAASPPELPSGELAAVQPAAVQPAAVQPAAVQPAAVQPAAVQLAAAQFAAVQLAAVPDKSGRTPHARGAGAAGRRPHSSEAEESGSTLARELALLQRARRALNRNDALLALGIVQSLDERFPNGVLMEERVATRILSLCQLDRADEARAQAQHFLLEHPRSVYAERVRHSCAGGR